MKNLYLQICHSFKCLFGQKEENREREREKKKKKKKGKIMTPPTPSCHVIKHFFYTAMKLLYLSWLKI